MVAGVYLEERYGYVPGLWLINLTFINGSVKSESFLKIEV